MRSEGDDPDSSTYKLWHPQKTVLMFNTEIRKHVQSCKRDRKSEKPNVGFQIGFARTPNTGACRIQNSATVIAPSISSMQKQATRLYIIRAPLGDTAVACVYALLFGKSQEVYEELFEVIAIARRFLTDFELAAIRAIETTFGQHVNHRGCFYHLTQSTWRKIQALALVERYKM
ncbi:hypothetical protein MAR_019936 [Mya arenaria]|uniref:MULE transposase domain-containing protein n=1 Tax=Mya arenaria TaxID=6604 RepID=A0ABY7E3I5_MYAAR|nr:hypothetical protein MAR_019936 [Mya arenaria]